MNENESQSLRYQVTPSDAKKYGKIIFLSEGSMSQSLRYQVTPSDREGGRKSLQQCSWVAIPSLSGHSFG